MALILEVVREGGTRTFHRLDRPLTVGRGFSNDLILDDPYLDARHARILLTEDGRVLVEDLGSLNGIVADRHKLRGAVQVFAGHELRLGRTTLRFRDPEESVGPALPDDGDIAPAGADAGTAAGAAGRRTGPTIERGAPATGTWSGLVLRWRAVADRTGGRILLTLLLLGAVALTTWLGDHSRDPGGEVFAGVSAVAVLIALWAGAWALGGRLAGGRANWLAHVGTASALSLVVLLAMTAGEWLHFLFPGHPLTEAYDAVSVLGAVAATIALHLRHSSRLAAAHRWRAGAITVGVMLVIGGIASLVESEQFSDVPTYDAALKPLVPGAVPTVTVDGFAEVLEEVRLEADEAAERMAEDATEAVD